MKKITKKVKCGCCGETVELEMIMSNRNVHTCFDGRPVEFPQGLIPLYQCPECFYTRKQISTPATEEMKRFVYGPVYQSRWIDEASLENIYLSGAELENNDMGIYCHLVLSWFAENKGNREDAEGYKRAVLNLYSGKDDEMTVQEAMICIDILRQLQEWGLALDCIKDTIAVSKQVQAQMPDDEKVKTFLKVLELEKMMVSNANSKAAYIGEEGYIEFLDFYE